jgi:hypothetical protein
MNPTAPNIHAAILHNKNTPVRILTINENGIWQKQTNKLHGLSPRANYTTEPPPLVGEVIANFCE